MKPRRNSLISALERIRQTQHRRGSFEEKNGVYHKKAEEVYRELSASQSTDLGPIRAVVIGFGNFRKRPPPCSSDEIFLAKIVSLRYIAFARLIRFFDVWIASACENVSKLRDPVCYWSRDRRGWASGRCSAAFTPAGG
jgi:hypothetical protein